MLIYAPTSCFVALETALTGLAQSDALIPEPGCLLLVVAAKQETLPMKLGDFLKQVEGLDPNTILCVAEVDEAFGSEIAQVEIIDNARQRSPDAADQEAVEFGNGQEKAVILRW
jgi:hypothetical protein